MQEYIITELRKLSDQFGSYAAECECAIGILKARLENLRRTGDIPFNFYDRIKAFDSVVEKCKRRGYPVDIQSIKKNIKDIGAMRVVTIFRDDIHKVVEDIRLFPGVTIVDEDDYVTNPKENGYSSYHLTVLVENIIGREAKKTPIEIQVRDNAMEFWAQIEHKIFYKKDHKDPKAQSALKQIADNLSEAAKLSVKLRDEVKVTDNTTEAAKLAVNLHDEAKSTNITKISTASKVATKKVAKK